MLGHRFICANVICSVTLAEAFTELECTLTADLAYLSKYSQPETYHFTSQPSILMLLDVSTVTNVDDVTCFNVECMCTVTRESLIDVTIETAVSRMQTIVELGRVVRDRRTLPMKACRHV